MQSRLAKGYQVNAGLNGPGPTIALGGTLENGAEVIHLGSDSPVQVFAESGRVGKEILERIQLEKYRLDSLLRSGRIPFKDVRHGSNPPDFSVLVDEQNVRLDCAALTIQSRRTAYRLFQSLRNEIMQCAKSVSFESIGGCVLHLTFGEEAGLPPKRSDKNALQKIVQAIANFPDRRREMAQLNADILAQGRMPDRLPLDILTGQAPNGLASFSVNLVPDGFLGGEFFDMTGFECALGMSFEITHQSVFAEISRLVSQHDQDDIDHLLITVGGPDREGFIYPGEEFMYAFAQDFQPSCSHLRRVTLHSFMTGDVADLAVQRVTAG